MCKKLLFLISFVLVLVLAGSASAAVKFDYRACWWSDLGPGHDWNEPNNWYTMDRYWNDVDDDNDIDTSERKFYVKEPNQVPDANTVVFVGKGTPRIDYPEYLHFNPPPFEPTISLGTEAAANNVWVGGGYSQDPNGDSWPGFDVEDPDPNLWTPPIYHWDPCLAHELTVNGGTLNIGTPQTWEGYDTQYDTMYGTMQSMGYFNGMFSGSCLRIGTVGWSAHLLWPGNGRGTMNMNGGTVNVGGHMEVGAWEENIGTLNMTDGVINITQGLYCPSAWDGTGRVNLWGGIINARYIFMNDYIRTTGSIDIAGGKFILSRGNEVEELTDYSNGIGTLGLGVVSLTAYGVGDGDIITDDVNYPDANGKRADLSIDYDVSNEGKTTVQTFLTDPNQAWNPSPPNGAGNVKGTVADIKRPVLSWSAGDGATSHEVYFDANEALVSARHGSVLKQSSYVPTSWTVDSDLTSFVTYYWAIDENPVPTLGQTWSFTMANLAKAGPPSPEDGAKNVNPAVNLSWGAGIYADSHNVYFSTDFNDVNDRDPCVLTNRPTNDYDPPLEFSTTFFWRVDECNEYGKPEWPGDLWSFTTHDRIVVETFDSYANQDALKAVWKDYWDDTGSKNGGQIFIETDPALVRSGKSMKFYYVNNKDHKVGGKFVGSWAEAATTDLQAGADWTTAGVKGLVLYFQGDPCNGKDTTGLDQDQMYVELATGGTAAVVEYDDDMNDVKEAFWHEWNIELQDFNDGGATLSNVDTVYIGFGGNAKTGQTDPGAGMDWGYGDTVYFEDIELWPIRCVPAESLAADFTGDCVVDEQDLVLMAGDWLARDGSVVATAPSDVNLVARWEFEGDYTDSNGSNDGVPYGDVTTVSDPCRGNVLECDGDGDYVEIPGSNTPGGVFDIRNAITLSAWIKLSVIENEWPAIIAKGDDNWGWRIARMGKDGEVLEFCAAGISGGALEPYGNVVGSVPVVDGLWHHAAGVYDGSKVCVYVDGIVDNCENGSGPIDTSDHSHVWIGSNEGTPTKTAWTGYIDDVRVYNCALQSGEIAVLAGKEGSIYVPLSVPANLVNLVPKDPPGGPFDPNNLDIVNFLDYGKLAEHWLEQKLFPFE